jgi:hypothetical protein
MLELRWKDRYSVDLILDSIDPSCSYEEDRELENGDYLCICRNCTKPFIGYKRRTICKRCLKIEKVKNMITDCLEE